MTRGRRPSVCRTCGEPLPRGTKMDHRVETGHGVNTCARQGCANVQRPSFEPKGDPYCAQHREELNVRWRKAHPEAARLIHRRKVAKWRRSRRAVAA